jgi:hypothetical protein
MEKNIKHFVGLRPRCRLKNWSNTKNRSVLKKEKVKISKEALNKRTEYSAKKIAGANKTNPTTVISERT